MDRNKNWKRIKSAYEAIILGKGQTANGAEDALLKAYNRGETDEFVCPTVILEKKKPVVFCGDLNVAYTPDDLARPKENIGKKGFTAEEREGIDRVVKAGFVDTFRLFTQGNGHYTWWSHFANARARNVGWRIDYIFVSGKLKSKVGKAVIHPDVVGSDHCPVEVEIRI